MALRRKCERKVVNDLTICNGNSKKSLIDKLFSVLNIWNMRATYFDLKLMIKEVRKFNFYLVLLFKIYTL